MMFKRGIPLVARAVPLVARPTAPLRSLSTTKPKCDVAEIEARLNHVAIACHDLEGTAAMYRDTLGATVSEPQDLPEHGVTVVFVVLANTKIELLHPLGCKSPIQNFLDRNKSGGIHHICVEVPNLEEYIARLKAKGVRLLNEEPKIGAHGKPVVFLHPKDCGGVLLELEEQ